MVQTFQDKGSDVSFDDLRSLSIQQVRLAIRWNQYQGHTAGLATDLLQGNVVIMPEKYALDFFRYCQRNPKPCPLVGVSDTGNPILHTLGSDLDIRSDVPRYNIYTEGVLSEQVTNISEFWQDDLVTFVIGCSFTFEQALVSQNIPMRHIEMNKIVPMYRTNIETQPAGPFQGATVVSMRPMAIKHVIEAVEITSRFKHAHGTPLHIGDPSAIGIENINAPDWGDAVEIRAGEIPVFWACGVTPQVALEKAKLPFCITHAPGCMLITDVPGTECGG